MTPKPDLDALAEEAVGGRPFTDEELVQVDAIKRALQKLQQSHEAERDAAVREALERACDAAVAGCAACGGKGWTGGSKVVPDCCWQFLPTGECCGNAIPKEIDGREQCEYCGRQTEAICSLKPRSDMVCVQDGCPCLVIGPCTYACSCVNPVMSGGCLRCAKYGSDGGPW